MTPKAKAKELFNKYSISVEVYFKEDSIPRIVNATMRSKSAKKCALIAVDEILNTGIFATKDYWQEVKQEIEKL